MSAAYDAFAKDYQRTKSSPLRLGIEACTLEALLGELAGRSLLDVGCGEGFYARRARAAGASRVTGVDLSPAMIALAREAEAAAPLGIEYHVADAAGLPAFEPCDRVLAAYLFHYAPDRARLQRMAEGIAANLVPGGRLVALIENPDQPVEAYAGYDQYGFNKRAVEPRAEGARVEYALAAGRKLIRFDVHWYSRETYAVVLGGAGFVDIAWHRPVLDPAAEPGPWWQEYLDNPPVLALTATRAAISGTNQGTSHGANQAGPPTARPGAGP